eukprot:TRINITY_DN1868_c0_g1_i1.p1 TRINITY_DN1868_c0_g1~~TRINITY_DN1868_c0_g1_i1.p1  ORF type:complete len:157 (-),score=26.71 TRINITY_DN1868_c0_g1_i1:14-484(-)
MQQQQPVEELSFNLGTHGQSAREEELFLQHAREVEAEAASSFWATYFQRDVTKNTGSHARDHMANERTFLAWLRTSLGCIGLGVAVAKISLTKYGQLAGLTFISVGAIFLLYSSYRYFTVLGLLNQGLFQVNKFGVGLIVVMAIIATIVSFIIVFI